ncbi:MAG: RNA polymerase subunit sigma-24, partial [Eubacteriales bacterium]
YALNKYSPNIVYKFDDKIVEVTLEDYLAQNPDRTAEDFAELKALSDEMYHDQVVTENRTSRLDVSIDSIDEKAFVQEKSVLQNMVERDDKAKVMLAAKELLKKGKLTEVQKRRFIQHYFMGKSYREIAKKEGVFFTSVAESICAASDKLKKIFSEF